MFQVKIEMEFVIAECPSLLSIEWRLSFSGHLSDSENDWEY